MADDNRLRSYRTNDPYGRAAEPAQPEASIRDPLAELARLLGQSDPFADFGQAKRSSREAHDAPATAPADWQVAAAREPQFAAGDSTQRWADYSPAPESSDSHFNDDAHASAEYQSGYYADARADDGHQEPEYYEGDDVPLDPHEDAMYDDPPRARGSRLATALTIIGCAVLGTAGAYAFRSYHSSPSATPAPPVITADASTPTKIVPAADPQSSKSVQDRLASAEKEQIVSKQEEPVSLKDLANQASSRAAPLATGPGQGASAAQPSAGAPGASNEPKKIRTVTIRADAGDMSGKPVTIQGAPAQAAPAPAATAPRQAATPPAPKAAPARNGGPISLDAQSEPSAAPATRTRTAAAPPVAARAAPDTTESTVDGFMVQLSSQKSEAEAQSAFRSLQAKFPNELSGLAPVVRRADLGSKGVFYRTMVGPFASAQEAGQFCANYKAAGGQCVVPNN